MKTERNVGLYVNWSDKGFRATVLWCLILGGSFLKEI